MNTSSCGKQRLCSECADAQASLNIRRVHMSKGTFSHIEAQILLNFPTFVLGLCFSNFINPCPAE